MFDVIESSGDLTFEKGIEGADSPYDVDHILSDFKISFQKGIASVSIGDEMTLTLTDLNPLLVASEILSIGSITQISTRESATEVIIVGSGHGIQEAHAREVELIESMVESEEIQDGVIKWTLPLPVTGIMPGDTLSLNNAVNAKQAHFKGSMIVNNISWHGSQGKFTLTIEGTEITG